MWNQFNPMNQEVQGDHQKQKHTTKSRRKTEGPVLREKSRDYWVTPVRRELKASRLKTMCFKYKRDAKAIKK